MKPKLLLLVFLMTAPLWGQNTAKEFTDDYGHTYLIGNFESENLLEEPYSEWYNTYFDYHSLDEEAVASFKEQLGKYNILVFMGTWCSDSQREVPALLKILKASDFPEDQLKLIAVYGRGDNYKTSPGGEEWGLQIKKVPTVIFIKDGKEVNRIVESPVESLEKDIQAIVSGKDYVPNYAELMKSK